MFANNKKVFFWSGCHYCFDEYLLGMEIIFLFLLSIDRYFSVYICEARLWFDHETLAKSNFPRRTIWRNTYISPVICNKSRQSFEPFVIPLIIHQSALLTNTHCIVVLLKSAPLFRRRVSVSLRVYYISGIMHIPLIARFMGPTWGPPGADRTQVGTRLAPWSLLSGTVSILRRFVVVRYWMI